jgi:hypothetical protein
VVNVEDKVPPRTIPTRSVRGQVIPVSVSALLGIRVGLVDVASSLRIVGPAASVAIKLPESLMVLAFISRVDAEKLYSSVPDTAIVRA